jgi:hypothetical protein
MRLSNSSFRLKKDSKRLLSFILDSHRRGQVKRCMIEAQLQSEVKPKASKEDKSSTEEK